MNYIGTKLKIIIIAVRGNIQILLFCLAFLIGFMGCKSTKETENIAAVSQPTASQPIGEITLSDIEAAVANQSTVSIKPIDIKAPGFFWQLQPWKEGTLATIDGWGRFAKISFRGADKMRITPLVDFPRMKMDSRLLTWPEAGLITNRTSYQRHHVVWVDGGKTKSFNPMLTWVHYIGDPIPLDTNEGLIAYGYTHKYPDPYPEETLFFYNYKEDRMVYESPKGFTIGLDLAMDDKYVLGYERKYDEEEKKRTHRRIFYNWRTGEIEENDLTKMIMKNGMGMYLNPCFNIDMVGKYFIEDSSILKQKCKVSWDKEYSDIKITPLNYLLPPKAMWFDNFIISLNGKWASTLVGGYRGLRDDLLDKRVFFHMDERYPNGISMPVLTEDYEEDQVNCFAFVNHPVHGMCFAQEWRKGKKQYLRLYKMDDVFAEINRQLLEVKK